MADKQTQSEKDFELFCTARGWKFEKLTTRKGVQTPDYRVTTDQGCVFIAEVTESAKEFVPTPPKVAVESTSDRSPQLPVQTESDRRGRLVGNKISSKRDQVQALETDDPTMIVVYAKDLTASIHMDADEMDYRLNGTHQAVLTPGAETAELRNADDGLFAQDEYKGVSAVATLYQIQDSNGIPLRLKIYHNPNATHSLPPHTVVGDFVEHFEKKEDGVGWKDPFGVRPDD